MRGDRRRLPTGSMRFAQAFSLSVPLLRKTCSQDVHALSWVCQDMVECEAG